MTKVKICGINGETAMDSAVAAEADFIGFVFFQRSPRFVQPRQAAALSARHSGGPKRVGLFVLPAMAEIEAVLQVAPMDILQLYAPEGLCAQAAERFGLPVWRAVGVKATVDLPGAVTAESGLVIESAAPAEAARPGGNALTMDWTLLRGWQAPCFWLLAGGLNADNVGQAIRETGAPAVDVSSGVETLPGVKSPALIRRFIANARSAAHQD